MTRATRRRHVVAGLVPARVVEDLELVEVDEQQRELAVLAARALDLLLEPLVQVAVVVEAREAVGDRLELGAAPADRGRLQHRRQVLGAGRDGAAAGRADSTAGTSTVTAADDGAVGVAHRGDARHPDAELVGVEDVGVQALAGEHGGELVVRAATASPQWETLVRRLARVEHGDALVADHGEAW